MALVSGVQQFLNKQGISDRLKRGLEEGKAAYTVQTHPTAYTAQEIAAAQHVSGRQLAKSVLVNTDHGPVLAVLPAATLVDFKKLKTLLRAKKVRMASEGDIRRVFPDVEPGAMAPFGQLYNVPVVLDRALAEADEVVFNAGSHTHTIKMRSQDLTRLVKPTLGNFSQPFPSPAKRARRPAASKARRGKTRPVRKTKTATRRRRTRYPTT